MYIVLNTFKSFLKWFVFIVNHCNRVHRFSGNGMFLEIFLRLLGSYILRTGNESLKPCIKCVIVCKIFFCSKCSDILEKSWRKRRRWRKPANVKLFVFQANVINKYIFLNQIYTVVNG